MKEVIHVNSEDPQVPALEEKLKEVSTFEVTKGSTPSRAEVVAAFQDTFELVGGLPRLVLWADENYGEFVKLYSKLLPSTSAVMLDAEVRHVVEHKLPPPRLKSGAIINGKALNNDRQEGTPESSERSGTY